MTVLLGLDLSPRAAAAVAVRLDWDGDFRYVHTRIAGRELAREASDGERALRCQHIAQQLVMFALQHRATEAWIEGYAFSMQSASVHTIAEVGGVVRLELLRHGIELRTANMGTARKLLLGKCPRKDAKLHAWAALKAAGAPHSWTLDESDAFVCANLGLSEHAGAFCFATEAPPPEPRKRRVKP